MNREGPFVEVDEDELPFAANGLNATAGKDTGEVGPRVACDSRLKDLHCDDVSACEPGRKFTDDGFDFGEFRHEPLL